MGDLNDDLEKSSDDVSVPKSPIELLRGGPGTNGVYDEWLEQVGGRRAYYIRGYSTFRNEVLKNSRAPQSALNTSPMMWGYLAADVLKEIDTRKEWHQPGVEWPDSYSVRQANDALTGKRKPISFLKAVQTIVLLELVARRVFESRKDKGEDETRDPAVVYHWMSIEAATSYIPGFDRSIFDGAMDRDKSFLDRLKAETGQSDPTVFYNMADRSHTVTYKLAWSVRKFFVENAQSQQLDRRLGTVSFTLVDGYKIAPSKAENIHADLWPEPFAKRLDARAESPRKADEVDSDRQEATNPADSGPVDGDAGPQPQSGLAQRSPNRSDLTDIERESARQAVSGNGGGSPAPVLAKDQNVGESSHSAGDSKTGDFGDEHS